jgi:hypothetical protein
MKLKNLVFSVIGIAFVFALLGASSQAAISPIGVAIIEPIQFPPRSFSIMGARVGALWGHHHKVYGVDLGGIGNRTFQEMAGVQVAGIFNANNGTTTAVGLQAAGVGNWNINKARVVGVQLAGLLNNNRAESFALGAVVAAANLTAHTKIIGIEAGVYNHAREVYGFQVGLINKTDDLHGFQIGLLNYFNKGLFAVSPILNVGF